MPIPYELLATDYMQIEPVLQALVKQVGLFGVRLGISLDEADALGVDPDSDRFLVDFDEDDRVNRVSVGWEGATVENHAAVVACFEEKLGAPSLDRRGKGKRADLTTEFVNGREAVSVKTHWHPGAEETFLSIDLFVLEVEDEDEDE